MKKLLRILAALTAIAHIHAATNEGDPEAKSAAVAAGIAKRKNAPIAVTARMTADGKPSPNFLAAPGQRIEFDLAFTVPAQKGKAFDCIIRVADSRSGALHEETFRANADAAGKFARKFSMPQHAAPGYGLLRFFIGGEELKPDPFFAISFAVIDPAVKTATLDEASPYGVCAHFSDSPVMLDALQRVGIKWVRNQHTARWGDVEHVRGKFDFSDTLAWLRTLRDHGMMRLERLDRGPGWAQRDPKDKGKGPPRDLADWTNYVAATVRALAEFRPHYEVWNEPDIAQFWSGTADEYIALLNAAHDAAKSVDPKSVIVMAGVTSGFANPTEQPQRRAFVEQVMKQGRFDVGCAHVYDKVETAENAFTQLRALMAANGHGAKPAYFSEMGKHTWHAAKSSATEHQQAQWHVKKVLIGLGAGISKFFNFNSISDPHSMPFDHGMMRANFAPKPIMAAQSALAGIVGNGKFVRELNLAPEVRTLEFNYAGRTITVLWTRDGKPKTTVKLPSAAKPLVSDLFGAPIAAPYENGASI